MDKSKFAFKKVLFTIIMIFSVSLVSSIFFENFGIGVLTAAETIKIMPIGDSCTAGMGDPDMGSYRTDLYRYYIDDGLSIDFVGSQKGGPYNLPDRDHEGHSGWMIPQIADNIDAWLNTYNPDVVLLWIGGNDAILGGNANTSGLSNLIDQILNFDSSIKIFVADYYPVPAQIVQYNETIPGVVQEKAAAGKEVYFVKLSDIDLVINTDISMDGLHLSPAGYSKIAKIWYDNTISILQSMSGTTLMGDVNSDGLVDTQDYILLKRYIANLINENSINIENADLNSDGEVNSMDYIILRRVILGTVQLNSC